MALRLIVLTAALVACQAVPIWFAENGFLPGTVFIREGRSSPFAPPSIAYGFGSGFASNIGGISNSNSFGASFQTGDAEAFGAGLSSTDGNFARGIGYAKANPAPQQQLYRTSYSPIGYSPYNGLRHNYGNNYGTAISSAQNTGNYGNAVAQAYNSPYGSAAQDGRYRSAVSSAQNLGLRGYGSSLSSASSNDYGSAATSSVNDYGTAISSAQTRDGHGYNSAVSASHSGDGISASTAQTVQQNGGTLQHSGATSINGPNFQATQSHAIKTY